TKRNPEFRMRNRSNCVEIIPHSIFRIQHSICWLLMPVCLGADSRPISEPALLISSPVTHSAWMLHKPAPQWGAEGVRQILDRCREAGIRRVYWRCFDGGRALYASRLVEPEHGFDADNYHVGRDSAWVLDALKQYDYATFDSFRAALAYGHQTGFE